MILQHYVNYWWIGGVEHYLLALMDAIPEWTHRIHVRHSVHAEAAALLTKRGIDMTRGTRYDVHSGADIIVAHNQPPGFPTNKSSGGIPVMAIHHGYPTTWKNNHADVLNFSVNADGTRWYAIETGEHVPCLAPGLKSPPKVKTSYAFKYSVPRIGLVTSPRRQKVSPKLVLACNMLVKMGEKFVLRVLGIKGFEQQFRNARFKYDLLAPDVSEGKWTFLRDLDVGFYTAQCQEGFGIALQEMLAVGLPCVTDDVGGVRDQVRSGINGFRTSRPEGAALVLQRLIQSEALRRSMGKAAAQVVRDIYSLEHFAERWRTAVELTRDLANRE